MSLYLQTFHELFKTVFSLLYFFSCILWHYLQEKEVIIKMVERAKQNPYVELKTAEDIKKVLFPGKAFRIRNLETGIRQF